MSPVSDVMKNQVVRLSLAELILTPQLSSVVSQQSSYCNSDGALTTNQPRREYRDLRQDCAALQSTLSR